MPRTLFVLLAVLMLPGCSRSASAPLRASLFPYWTLEQLPDGPPEGDPPTPVATAVLIAPGYLLTTIEGMGDVATDFGRDPTVYVHDGTGWQTGRYVDRDMKLRIALIRADVAGTPVRLPREAVRAATIVGASPFDPDQMRASSFGGPRCAESPRSFPDDFSPRRRAPSVCVQMVVGNLPGGVMLDEGGALASVQTQPYGVGQSSGPDAAEIRDFLDLYFATWGSAVRPKPEY